MRICVIGTGYVGLVTGTVFANLGNQVVCVDSDPTKIENLKAGRMPIYEPGLEEMVKHNVKDGRLSFTTSLASGVQESEVIFIAVGTPPKNDGETDLSQVEECAIEIARNLNGPKVIVNKSTVPVGTGDLVREVIEQHKTSNEPFDVVSNPEFLREGNAIQDTLKPDRIVIGAANREAAMKLLELYAPLERPIMITDVYSAEMIKYASNAFLATKISFINAIADLCEKTGADVTQVARGMGYDSRIGVEFLNAGLGYGGSCFGKDVSSLLYVSESLGYDFGLLRATVDINSKRVAGFVARMKEAAGSLEGKTVAIWGLAFKPNTDDLRDAKSLELMQSIVREGAMVRAYDPLAMESCRELMPFATYCQSPYEAAAGADIVCLVTEWDEFRFVDFERLKGTMRGNIIFDGRNVYDARRMTALGFRYYSIGRAVGGNGTPSAFSAAAMERAARPLWHVGSQPGRVRESYAAGLRYYDRELYAEAISEFERFLAETGDPTHPQSRLAAFYVAQARAHIGQSCAKTGKLERAEKELQCALQMNPNYADLQYSLAEVKFRKGEYAQAAEEAARALSINPNYARARFLYGLSQLKTGHTDEAFREMQSALSAEPGLISGDLPSMKATYLAGDLSQADAISESFFKIDTDEVAYLVRRANLHFSEGEMEEACALYGQVLEMNPNYADVHNSVGICFGQMREYDRSIHHFEQAIKLNENYVAARLNLGIAFMLAGRAEEAREQFAAVIQLQPDNEVARGELLLLEAERAGDRQPIEAFG